MADHHLHITTLGAFMIEHEGQVVESFLTRKTALLLVYLAMNPSKHARETLAPLFWSETSDEQALKNLRTVLSDLRKNTPDAVQITRQAVEISDAVWIDAGHFEAGCDAILAGGNTPLDGMLGLADLYCGEFLRDLYIRQADVLQAWIAQRREQLQHKYEQLLYHIAGHCLKTDNAYIGVNVARQLVMLNPLWEAAQRQLMELLVQLDQSGEALMQYERVVALLDAELGVDPDTETVALYQQIKSGALTAARPQPMSHIVLPDVPYIPPQHDLALLRDMLSKPDCRLITLTGIGGTGKTMLATFIAHERQAAYPDGVAIVSLAAVRHVSMLPQTILTSLNVTVKDIASADQVVAELSERAMLLVLDNYEHLLADTALISRIINEAPGVQVLVTSQIALNLSNEWLLPLTGLNITQPGESEAVQLFRKTAERARPHFEMTPYFDDVRQICALLDGLPLGIVIAAGQVKYYSPPEILATVRDDPLVLTSPYQDLPTRHRGFTNLIQTTLQHLSAEEQQALYALAIFRGSFTHEAALAVADIDMRVFIQLVDKSLVQRTENFRYRVHSLLGRIFIQQLTASGQQDAARQRLTAYYVAWCRDLYRRKLERDDDLLLIDAEHANLWHLDLLTPFEQGRYLLEIIPTMRKYWQNRGFAAQVTEIVAAAVLDEGYSPGLRARGMTELASLLIASGEQQQVQALCQQAMRIAPDNLYVQVDALQQLARLEMQRGDNQAAWAHLMTVLELESSYTSDDDPLTPYLFVGNHNGMGLAALHMDETEVARMHFNIAMAGWQQLNEPLLQMQVRSNLALLDMREGHYTVARQHFEAIIPLAQAAGLDSSVMIYMGNFGKTLMMLGDYAGAHACLCESLTIASRLKRKSTILNQLETLAELAFRIERYVIAAQLYGYLLYRSKQDSIPYWPSTVEKIQGYITVMRTELGPRYGATAHLGSMLSQDAAMALAQSLSIYLDQAPDAT